MLTIAVQTTIVTDHYYSLGNTTEILGLVLITSVSLETHLMRRLADKLYHPFYLYFLVTTQILWVSWTITLLIRISLNVILQPHELIFFLLSGILLEMINCITLLGVVERYRDLAKSFDSLRGDLITTTSTLGIRIPSFIIIFIDITSVILFIYTPIHLPVIAMVSTLHIPAICYLYLSTRQISQGFKKRMGGHDGIVKTDSSLDLCNLVS